MSSARFAPALCLSLLVLIPAVKLQAAEIVVQNDSIVDGNFGAIQAGFAAGESAAAWLTTPCDGTIVAVQVFWRSVTGTTGISIEDSITIYSGGTFPTPSGVAAELLGPVMTDGVLNEFRFIDDNQTIPIDVPVTEDQTFVISFKFANTPSPTNGPSVVTDTNGFMLQSNAIDCAPGLCCSGWTGFEGMLFLCQPSGDLFIRAVVDCPSIQPTGACCFDNGDCVAAQQQDDCLSNAGAWQGANSQCMLGICERACCFLPNGCVDLIPDDCEMIGGFVQAPGNLCADPGFECFPTGACCNLNGSCDDAVLDVNCTASGGTFQGDGSLCSQTTCAQPEGACCLNNGFCLSLLQDECGQIPSSLFWAGAQTTCADDDQSGTADACEGGPSCAGGTLAECGDTNGDGKRDDACLWFECDTGVCSSMARVTQADLAGSIGSCLIDGTCDANDRFHALNCFADKTTTGAPGYPCEDAPPLAINVDAVGSNGSCVLDGTCDGNDAFAALNCFSNLSTFGVAPFPCACGPHPDPPPAGKRQLRPVPGPVMSLHSPRDARPGEQIEVRVHLDDPVDAVRGYQLHLFAGGGARGRLELVDIAVDQGRPDYAFGEGAEAWKAFNPAVAQMVAGLDAVEGVTTPAGGYLATFTYRASPDAAGIFVIDLRYDSRSSNPQDRTFLFGPFGRLLEVKPATPVSIEVSPRRGQTALR